MDAIEIVGWIVAVLAVAAAVYFRLTGKSKGDVQLLDQFYRYQMAAREAVAAAEQLWRTGQIPEVNGEKDARFIWAANRVREFFPDLTDEALEMTVEAAVFWLKGGVERWQATNAVLETQEVPRVQITG